MDFFVFKFLNFFFFFIDFYHHLYTINKVNKQKKSQGNLLQTQGIYSKPRDFIPNPDTLFQT